MHGIVARFGGMRQSHAPRKRSVFFITVKKLLKAVFLFHSGESIPGPPEVWNEL